jgi:uncharacterized protein (TIGR03000 family)
MGSFNTGRSHAGNGFPRGGFPGALARGHFNAHGFQGRVHGGPFFGGGGFAYPAYGLGLASPSLGLDYYPGNYGYDLSAPGYDSYYATPPMSYEQQPSAVLVPQTNDYDGFESGSFTNPEQANLTTVDVTVRVPDPNAEIWFDNYQTHERGLVRQFQSEGLQPGETYTFHIRARWVENGQLVERHRDVPARAGQLLSVDFNSAGIRDLK